MSIIELTNHYQKQFTATGYIINTEKTKMLLIHHKKLQRWLPPGGHIEENELPHECALREVFEETGVHAKLLQLRQETLQIDEAEAVSIPSPFSICYEVIPASTTQGSHIHVDMLYVLESDEHDAPIKPNHEVNGVCWYNKHEIRNNLNTFEIVKEFANKYLK